MLFVNRAETFASCSATLHNTILVSNGGGVLRILKGDAMLRIAVASQVATTHGAIRRAYRLAAPLSILLGFAWLTVPASGQSGAKNGEWHHYGGDLGATRYSPLDQINKENVRNLRIAWRWKTENFGPRPDYNWETTPLMIGGVLYTTAGGRRDVVAIDAATGETIWMYRYDEGARARRNPNRTAAGRGVAYWTDGKGDERIFYVTQGYRLVALHAKTGQPVASFGAEGVIDLYEGLEQPGRAPPQDGQLAWSSAPIVVRDVVVVGANLQGLAPTPSFIAGFPRGFDVRTGKRLWTFHTIPEPGELGNETWENDSWSYTGNTGVWGGITADEELGYVYLPVETPTNDYYGGKRPGDGLFSETLVCLDAKTGKRVWHFQLVHHGIWDFDIPAPPNLIDITVGGKRIKAVAQTSKQSFVYVFDRVTGQPVWPIPEQPVPQSDVPGEKTARTQPHPTRPAPYDHQGIGPDNIIDFTPQLKAEALKILSQYKFGPLFTPPIVGGSNGLKGTLVIRAGNWQGGTVDPESGIMYVPSAENLNVMALRPDAERGYINGDVDNASRPAPAAPQSAAPRTDSPAPPAVAPIVGDGLGPEGLPLIKPPYGRITAIDLNSGEHVWMIPNGETPESIRNHPALRGVTIPKTGTPERAGMVVTKTLLFAGEGGGLYGSMGAKGGGGPMFRALDKQTGAEIWKIELPANQTGVPMTYMVNGKQYIVVATGARNHPAELVALSLP